MKQVGIDRDCIEFRMERAEERERSAIRWYERIKRIWRKLVRGAQ